MTKETTKKEEAKTVKKTVAPKRSAGKYIEAVGRRKTSSARVRIVEGDKEGITVNGKDVAVYFPTAELQAIVTSAIEKAKATAKFTVTIVVRGGGVHSQAEAVRQGLARTLVKYDAELRARLKKLGYLKRDARMKERRKFGLKKARKAPQWSKR